MKPVEAANLAAEALTAETLEVRIGRVASLLDALLRALQQARRSAHAGARTARLLAVRADYEAGLPRAALLGRHGCTRGQLAAWARRFAWQRPPPRRLVKMLQGRQRAAYRRYRLSGMPRPEALAQVSALEARP